MFDGDMEKVGGWLVFFLVFSVGAEIVIKEIAGPSSIDITTGIDDVVLDCVYEAIDEENIVVKWFFEDDKDVVYQWIPPAKHGYASGTLKEFIDPHFSITNDTGTMHRALRIFDINPQMSGNFTCVVSSDDSEASMVHTLTIYTPATEGLRMRLLQNDNIVLCSVIGVSPVPDLDISIKEENETKLSFERDMIIEKDEDDGFTMYNVTTTLHFYPMNISRDITFVCDLNIPGTDYVLSEEEVFYTDNAAPETKLTSLSVAFFFVLILNNLIT